MQPKQSVRQTQTDAGRPAPSYAMRPGSRPGTWEIVSVRPLANGRARITPLAEAGSATRAADMVEKMARGARVLASEAIQ